MSRAADLGGEAAQEAESVPAPRKGRRSRWVQTAVLVVPVLMLQALLLWSWIDVALDSQKKPCNELLDGAALQAANVLRKTLQPARVTANLASKCPLSHSGMYL